MLLSQVLTEKPNRRLRTTDDDGALSLLMLQVLLVRSAGERQRRT